MRESKVLKAISYTLIPILTLIIIISVFYEIFKDEIKNRPVTNPDYFQSDDFLGRYMYRLSNRAYDLIYNNENYTGLKDGENEIFYFNGYDQTESDNYIKDFYYLIQYQDLSITNIELTEETNTVDELKQYIASREGKKANIINGNVQAEAEVISKKAIKHFDKFNFTYYTVEPEELIKERTKETSETDIEIEEEIAEEYSIINGEIVYRSTPDVEYVKQYFETSISDFQINTTYQEEIVIGANEEVLEELIIILTPYENAILITLPIASILLVLVIIYLFISIGHSKGKEGIDLNDFDKVPIEIIYFIFFMLWGIALSVPIAYLQYENANIYLFMSMFVTGYFVGAVCLMLPVITTIKRLKAKVFWKTTLIGMVCCWCFKVCKKINKILKGKFNSVTKTWNKTLKLLLIVIGYIILLIILIALFNVIGFLVSTVIGVYLVYKFNERIVCYEQIEKHLKEMYEGDHSKKLNYQEFTPEFQDMVKYINDVSSGFENAIQEGIKSERLKTELITNVSHDIKTPLTSIINYVDLLRKENIENEKAKEYIDILDNKSQRLKKLTEDLVEASKASSGNVKLNIEKLNICELIKQATGEFEDKFKSKNLDIIFNSPEEDIYINADNRYMYRIIENLFGNISKYALDASRVYIDITKSGLKAKISIKNISKDKLNISVDELMQRFVRGDKSRTTEGSGLGISISKSLTEIQKGKFELKVDGDLFKVELEFDIA